MCLSEVRPHPLEVSSKQTKGEERELLPSFADETEKNYYPCFFPPMSRLADLQHRPGMSPGCFLTLYQGQIQAQRTLASTERKHGCRVPVEPRYTLLTGLIWTPAYRPRSLDRTQHTERNHTQTSAAVQHLHYKTSLSHLGSVCERVQPPNALQHQGRRLTHRVLGSRASRTCAAGHQADTKATTLTLFLHLLCDS